MSLSNNKNVLDNDPYRGCKLFGVFLDVCLNCPTMRSMDEAHDDEGDSQEKESIIEKKTWKEFRDNGFLWWINTILCMFGWSIVIQTEGLHDDIIDAFPARVSTRGFSEKENTTGYKRVTKFLKKNIKKLYKEAKH